MSTAAGFTRAQRLYGWTAIGISLLALALVVAWGRQRLREQMRSQMLGRDALILSALTRHAQDSPVPPFDALDPSDPAYQYATLVRVATLTNILVSRLFTPDGQFYDGMPDHVRESALTVETLKQLRRGAAVARFLPDIPRELLLLELPDEGETTHRIIDCVEIDVPFIDAEAGELTGVAQFILEGVTMRREFELLDQRLNRQSLLGFGAAASLVTLGMGWAVRKLVRSNRLLMARTADLHRANQELVQSAKVAAVGAVTAHLIHSLRNPVAGLQSFVVARSDQARAEEGDEWREALAATRRMHDVIQHVVEVLRAHEQDPAYSLSPRELGERVIAELEPIAKSRGAVLQLETGPAEGVLDNRTAGLVHIILLNLALNAIQASRSAGVVHLRSRPSPAGVTFEVSDQGTGIPPQHRDQLFQPVRSSKEGGTGIGLAICRQLALHLGADLRLAATSDRGTTFMLTVPQL